MSTARKGSVLYPDDVLRFQDPAAPTPTIQIQRTSLRPTAPQRAQTQKYQNTERITEDDENLIVTGSQRRHPVPPRRRAQAADPTYTSGDKPGLRRRRQHGTARRFHGAVWMILTLIAVVTFWWVTTSGLAWWDTTYSDPGMYGPTHGQMIAAVLGGGDSTQHPTKLIAMNNGGHVLLIEIPAGNDYSKAKLLAGPNLAAQGFPDSQNAVISLQAGDYTHDGFTDVQVTIYATLYDKPFHRYSVTYYLYGNGAGGLKSSGGI
ncbi:MAG: hypothetical protein ABI413_02215 [Ktedonobacteraceae bacterium]